MEMITQPPVTGSLRSSGTATPVQSFERESQFVASARSKRDIAQVRHLRRAYPAARSRHRSGPAPRGPPHGGHNPARNAACCAVRPGPMARSGAPNSSVWRVFTSMNTGWSLIPATRSISPRSGLHPVIPGHDRHPGALQEAMRHIFAPAARGHGLPPNRAAPVMTQRVRHLQETQKHAST